jgi:hypothetical protein
MNPHTRPGREQVQPLPRSGTHPTPTAGRIPPAGPDAPPPPRLCPPPDPTGGPAPRTPRTGPGSAGASPLGGKRWR